MKLTYRLVVLFVILFVYSCDNAVQNKNPLNPSVSPSLTAPPNPPTLWIGAAVPESLREAALAWGVPLMDTKEGAGLWLNVDQQSETESPKSVWIYVLVAPFPTVPDGVTYHELLSSWKGSPSGPFAGAPLLMAESTLEALKLLWGEPTPASVKIISSNLLLDQAWKTNPSWVILPFEELEPRWKVLTVDGQAPIRKDFDAAAYPLQVTFSLTSSQSSSLQKESFSLPVTNRDPSKMTTVIVTGVTALVRATAFRMEQKGITYPGRDIRGILREADITHISNEIPFDSHCPYPDPAQKELKFCSSPRYFELLTDIGADVIELTGNHFGDQGPGPTLETLEIYKNAAIPYYGGGADLKDARKPILLERNGNKIAFIGCNRPDIGNHETATDKRPGAAPCDFNYLTQEIRDLASQGYLVITTFQWIERGEFDPRPIPAQRDEFRLMADSGATIVSGSQAHFPLTMEFYGQSFIHYGLGNLFFDQMSSINRKEFLDRYIIYNNRLVSIELLTMMLEDFSRPRPMTPEERASLLQEYFKFSGWSIPSQNSQAN
jgi:hypothetical protein